MRHMSCLDRQGVTAGAPHPAILPAQMGHIVAAAADAAYLLAHKYSPVRGTGD